VSVIGVSPELMEQAQISHVTVFNNNNVKSFLLCCFTDKFSRGIDDTEILSNDE
jgi:hypothetical protein